LIGNEGRFSWRKHTEDEFQLTDFEDKAGRCIATYRHLKQLKSDTHELFSKKLDLTKESSFEEAAEYGEKIAKYYDLGDIPSITLQSFIENTHNILVLYMDGIDGISGAACRLPDLNTILINRNEIIGRQNFDLAHEFFHLLTWDVMPPSHLDAGSKSKGKQHRIEQLAENFAAGLLMPSWSLIERYESRGESDIHEWLNQTADEYGVSSTALKWRICNLELLPRAEIGLINDERLRNNGKFDSAEVKLKPLFSREFMEVIGWGIDNGYLSIRKASNVLGVTIDALSTLFEEHDLPLTFEL
jgi:Zn-dependent peptidase ImmA (M78 family)